MSVQTRVCNFYNPEECEKNPSTCNKTEEWCEYEPGKRSHCYTARQEKDGVFQVILEGCWFDDSDCYDQTECVATEDKKNHVYFCCCEGDYCNKNISHVPLTDYPTTPFSNTIYTGHTSLMSTLLFSLLPLIGIAGIIACGFWLYRRHKQAFHDPLPQQDQPHLDFIKPELTVESPLLDSTTDQCSSIQLLEVKARGRFGCVWKAHMKENQIVAVKVFPIQDQDSFITERDFYNLPQINTHSNLLYFILTEKRGTNLNMELWLITEFHERGSLYDHLKAHLLTWQDLIKIAVSMSRGLAFLHEDVPPNKVAGHKPAVAHRDFKSKNVLVKADLTACIADFGLAMKFEPGKCVGDTHGQVGTRRYMAPEVLEGAINFTRDAFLRIDMYACGLVLWELAQRCSAIDGPVDEYRLPFEEEVGQHPTLDDMQDAVVQNKLRPKLKELWLKHTGLCGLRDTIEECWDHDPEARLSAGCVEERLNQLTQLAEATTITDTTNSTSNRTDVPEVVQMPNTGSSSSPQEMLSTVPASETHV